MKDVENSLADIYFYELESRERIFNRLQLHFAIYTAIVTIIAYMARMIDYDSNCTILTLFYVGLICGLGLLVKSINLTMISLSGYKYMVSPRASDIINYRNKLETWRKNLEKYNQEYGFSIDVPDPQSSTKEFTLEIIAKCIDHNTTINEYRRKGVRNSIWYMVLASIPIVFSAVLFVIFDLDTSSPRKNLLIEDRNLTAEIKKLDSSITKFKIINTEKEKPTMSNEQSNQGNKVHPTPPPPPAPQKPKPQFSLEDLKESLPDKAKFLNEGK